MSDTSMIALITAIAAFATAALGSLTQLVISGRAAKRAEEKIDNTAKQVTENTQRLDGRLTKLLELATSEATIAGEVKGRAAADAEHAAKGEAKALAEAKGRAEGELQGRADMKAEIKANGGTLKKEP